MKGIKILIFSIIGILILGVILFSLAYFYTDTFKSNQELFYNNISEEQALNIINANEIEQLLTKIKNTKNEVNIDFLINASSNNETILDNCTLKVNSKMDNGNNKFESGIIFGNRDDENVLEFNIVRNNDIYGVIINDVINQYIAVENNKIDKLAKKLGIESDSIPEKIDVEELFNKELVTYSEYENKFTEISRELYRYLKENTNKTNYSKLEKTKIKVDEQYVDATGYELNLKGDELKTVINSVSKLKQESNTDKSLQVNNESEMELSVKIYLQDKKLVKIEILLQSIDGKNLIEIQKTESNFNLKFKDDENESQIILDSTRTGDINSDNIFYKINISLESDGNTKMDSEIKVDFDFNSKEDITELTEENSVVLNEFDGDKILNLFKIIGQKISKKEGIEDTLIGKIIAFENSRKSVVKRAVKSSKVPQIKEAATLAKADIIMAITTNEISLDSVNAESFTKKMNEYLTDELQRKMTIVTENNPNGVVEMKNRKINIYLDRIEGLTLQDGESKTIEIDFSNLAS